MNIGFQYFFLNVSPTIYLDL